MIGYARDRRRPARGPGAFTIGAVAAAAVAITSAVWPASGSLAATRTRVPANWAPVPFRLAQLSVRGGWLVADRNDGFFCPSKSEGMIFVGQEPQIPKDSGCHHLTPSFAWITVAGHVPPGITHRKPTAVINGIPVYQVRSVHRSAVYLVPELSVRVGVHGPLARRVLATLTRSPLAVVLAKGPAGAVPSSWVKHDFGGVRFATPRGWHLNRANVWETCGTGVGSRSLDLVNAKKPPIPLPCPIPFPTAKDFAGVPGLTVVTGKYAARSVAQTYRRCRSRAGTRICLSTETGAAGFYGAIINISVAKPHQRAKTYVLLGLSGSGVQARAIFDSIAVR